MAKPVKTQRRAYRSVLRAEQAEQTRRRILDAAGRLFIERGYAGTAITAVAQAAGVVPETVYGSLGT
jgi:AcrR family transcriptional regulator